MHPEGLQLFADAWCESVMVVAAIMPNAAMAMTNSAIVTFEFIILILEMLIYICFENVLNCIKTKYMHYVDNHTTHGIAIVTKCLLECIILLKIA